MAESPLRNLKAWLPEPVKRPLRRLRARAWRLAPRRVFHTVRWLGAQIGAIRRRRNEPRLTVGVDIGALWEPLTGVGWYLHQLVVHLADRDDLRLRLYGPTLVPSPDLPGPVVRLPAGRALEAVAYPVPEDLSIPAGRLIHTLRWLQPLLLAADANDVLFAPNYFLPRRFRLARGAVVAAVMDLGFRRARWTMNEATLREFEASLDDTLHRAHRLLAISVAMRDELVAFGYAAPERIHVVPLGPRALVAAGEASLPQELPPRYALFVGTLEPRKNVGVLLAAWRLLARRGATDLPVLLLCGRWGWKSEELRQDIERAQRQGLARHLGYVGEPELAALYRAATCLVLPSLYEGFGLPVVEAMAAGTPVVASDIPVLREVADEAALFADPRDPEAWAERLARVFTDAALRRRLVQRGRARAQDFSWRRTADATAQVWRRAAASERLDP